MRDLVHTVQCGVRLRGSMRAVGQEFRFYKGGCRLHPVCVLVMHKGNVDILFPHHWLAVMSLLAHMET